MRTAVDGAGRTKGMGMGGGLIMALAVERNKQIARKRYQEVTEALCRFAAAGDIQGLDRYCEMTHGVTPGLQGEVPCPFSRMPST